MQAHYHRYFEKRLAKLPAKIQEKALKRIALFQIEPFSQILDNHTLSGKYSGFRSIDITGDYRAVYRPLSDNAAIFVDIGRHSQLYK